MRQASTVSRLPVSISSDYHNVPRELGLFPCCRLSCFYTGSPFSSPGWLELTAALLSLLSADIAGSTPRLFYVWRVVFPGTLPNPF